MSGSGCENYATFGEQKSPKKGRYFCRVLPTALALVRSIEPELVRDLVVEPRRVAEFLLQPARLSQSDASERSATLSRAFGVGLDVLPLWPPPVDFLVSMVVERPRRAPKLFGCISLLFFSLKALAKVDCGVLFFAFEANA